MTTHDELRRLEKAATADGVLRLPTDPDEQRCLACGEDALDTGWECTSCGYDNMPWYYPTPHRGEPR